VWVARGYGCVCVWVQLSVSRRYVCVCDYVLHMCMDVTCGLYQACIYTCICVHACVCHHVFLHVCGCGMLGDRV